MLDLNPKKNFEHERTRKNLSFLCQRRTFYQKGLAVGWAGARWQLKVEGETTAGPMGEAIEANIQCHSLTTANNFCLLNIQVELHKAQIGGPQPLHSGKEFLEP